MVYKAGNGRARLLSGSDEVKSAMAIAGGLLATTGAEVFVMVAGGSAIAIGIDVPVDNILAPKQTDNDAILNQLKQGSLVVNATGIADNL